MRSNRGNGADVHLIIALVDRLFYPVMGCKVIEFAAGNFLDDALAMGKMAHMPAIQIAGDAQSVPCGA